MPLFYPLKSGGPRHDACVFVCVRYFYLFIFFGGEIKSPVLWGFASRNPTGALAAGASLLGLSQAAARRGAEVRGPRSMGARIDPAEPLWSTRAIYFSKRPPMVDPPVAMVYFHLLKNMSSPVGVNGKLFWFVLNQMEDNGRIPLSPRNETMRNYSLLVFAWESNHSRFFTWCRISCIRSVQGEIERFTG